MMARARNIKPKFFFNEDLGRTDPLMSLLFISLWCLADKKGRLEDRPLRIKAETFPYREGLDVNGYLTELERLGLIQRYRVNGKAYIQVIKFSEHQSPHNTEKNSVIPGPEHADGNNFDENHGDLGELLNNRDATVNARKQDGENLPDSRFTDSLIPEENKARAKTCSRAADKKLAPAKSAAVQTDAAASDDPTLPPWMPLAEWEGFVEMRRKIKKPLTGRAMCLAIKELETLRHLGQDPADVLNQSVFNCWKMLYPVKDGEISSVLIRERDSSQLELECGDEFGEQNDDGSFNL